MLGASKPTSNLSRRGQLRHWQFHKFIHRRSPTADAHRSGLGSSTTVHIFALLRLLLLIPIQRFSLFLSGLVHIRLPNSESEAWVQGGKYGILIAADTKVVSKDGHITDFPGGDDTVIAQFPFVDGKLPDYKLLYDGPCSLNEMIGM
jgi:hypothetical protein